MGVIKCTSGYDQVLSFRYVFARMAIYFLARVWGILCCSNTHKKFMILFLMVSLTPYSMRFPVKKGCHVFPNQHLCKKIIIWPGVVTYTLPNESMSEVQQRHRCLVLFLSHKLFYFISYIFHFRYKSYDTKGGTVLALLL